MAGKVGAEIVRPIERRIKKLETAQRRQKSVFVVSGYSDEEHQRQIDEAIACGKATPDSLFVCIREFPFKDRSDLKPDDREG
jgi:nicotinamidase-related amidase